MMKTLRLEVRLWMLLLAVAAWGGLAHAATIKTWISGDYLSVSDLNSNFAHIHNTMVGGHGGRLVNADVSSSAAIAHSKLAAPVLVPKVVCATVGACSTGTCTANGANSGCSSIVYGGSAGVYTVTYSAARTNGTYVPFAVATGTTANYCQVDSYNATTATVKCYSDAAAGENTEFSFLLFDDNN